MGGGSWDGHVHTDIFRMGNHSVIYLEWIRTTVKHTEPCSMLCGSWVGGEFGGEWIPVYIWLSCSAVHLKLSQHC